MAADLNINHYLNVRSQVISRISDVLKELKKLDFIYDPYKSAEPVFQGYRQSVDKKYLVVDYLFDPEDVIQVYPPPCFSVIHDPEVVADVSLYGNRTQRFFPIVIQGWVSMNPNDITCVSLYDIDGEVYTEEQILNGDNNIDDKVIPDIRRRNASLIADAYIDQIMAAMELPLNIEYFKLPLSVIGPNIDEPFALENDVAVTGFSIERIGPAIADNAPLVEDLAFLNVSIQTSFNQDVFDPEKHPQHAGKRFIPPIGREKYLENA